MSWLQKRQEKKVEASFASALSEWQTNVDNVNSCLTLAQSFVGGQTDQIELQPASHYKSTVPELIALLEDTLAEVQRNKPTEPISA